MKTATECVQALVRFVEDFRAMDPEITSQTIHVFLLVALNPGISPRELEIKTGLSQPSISRNIDNLRDIKRGGRSGLDLIETDLDPMDRRNILVFLSAKGKAVAARVARYLEPGVEPAPAEFPLRREAMRARSGAR